jgi:hypothetical protein
MSLLIVIKASAAIIPTVLPLWCARVSRCQILLACGGCHIAMLYVNRALNFYIRIAANIYKKSGGKEERFGADHATLDIISKV